MARKSEKPNPTEIARRLARLSPERRALLGELLKSEGLSLPGAMSIPRRSSATQPPLSFAQQRLWFLNQFDPGKATYNLSYYWRVHGPLDVEALRKSLNRIVERHEALRTSIGVVTGNRSR
jgi:hypothetical protein